MTHSVKIYICTIILMVSMGQAWCQSQKDISQYMFYQPVINPAAAGVFENFNAATYLRHQWAQVEGAPVKMGFMANMPFLTSTAGLSFFQEEIGVHRLQKVYGSYSYSINLKEEQMLTFGLSGGIDIENHNLKEATTNDPDFEFNQSYTKTGVNFQFGLYYAAKDYYVGLAIPNLVSSGIAFGDSTSYTGKSSVKPSYWEYNIHGGYQYMLNPEWDLYASFLMKYALNVPLDFDLNAQAVYKDFIGLGFSYRTKSEFLTIFNLKIIPQLKLAYTYHAYFGGEIEALGAHEVMLLLDLYKKKVAKIQSPRF